MTRVPEGGCAVPSAFLVAHMAVVQMASSPSRSTLLPSTFLSVVLFVFRWGAVQIFVFFLVPLAGEAV